MKKQNISWTVTIDIDQLIYSMSTKYRSRSAVCPQNMRIKEKLNRPFIRDFFS